MGGDDYIHSFVSADISLPDLFRAVHSALTAAKAVPTEVGIQLEGRDITRPVDGDQAKSASPELPQQILEALSQGAGSPSETYVVFQHSAGLIYAYPLWSEDLSRVCGAALSIPYKFEMRDGRSHQLVVSGLHRALRAMRTIAEFELESREGYEWQEEWERLMRGEVAGHYAVDLTRP